MTTSLHSVDAMSRLPKRGGLGIRHGLPVAVPRNAVVNPTSQAEAGTFLAPQAAEHV